MVAGNQALAVLAVSLRETVRQIVSPSDTCQVYSYNSSLLLQSLHNVAMQQLTRSAEQMLLSSSMSKLPC